LKVQFSYVVPACRFASPFKPPVSSIKIKAYISINNTLKSTCQGFAPKIFLLTVDGMRFYIKQMQSL
jgi:hypothetical protein